jgi:hypothetical protein
MEPDSTWQAQTDSFLRATNVAVCGNDYVGASRQGIRNLFAPPNATNADPRPVFLAINCLSNSPSHARYQVLINDYARIQTAQNLAVGLLNETMEYSKTHPAINPTLEAIGAKQSKTGALPASTPKPATK